MKSLIKVLLMSATVVAFSFLAASCDNKTNPDNPDNPGGDTTVVDRPLLQLEESVDVPSGGGEFTVSYTFENRPEDGQFVVSLPEDHWFSYVADDPEAGVLTFNAQENVDPDRTDTLAVRYDYNEGFVLDTVIIFQKGVNADYFIEAVNCTGEYYSTAGASGIGFGKFYDAWISTGGLWVDGSEGLDLVFFSDEPVETAPYPGNSDYTVVSILPEGTYVFDAESHEPGTFCDLSFYGISSGYYYTPRHDVVDGYFTIEHLGDGVMYIHAEVTCDDGLVYDLTFTGSNDKFMYM